MEKTVRLSKRLQMVADMVTKGNRVADIGCDHGYTSIYLVENQIAPSVIAMDINKGPLEKAKIHVARSGFEKQIEVRLSDGAKKLQQGETDALLISGMGGGLTVKILKDSLPITKSVKELVLQPQSEVFLVREFLHENGFVIVEEKMTIDAEKYYVSIHAVPGEETYCTEDAQETYIRYHYGKVLLETKDAVLHSYLTKEYNRIEKVLGNLKKGCNTSEKCISRMQELQKEIMRMQKALSYYEKE